MKKGLWILAVICVINSMGFGIVVPLLYSYGKKFGVTSETLGLLTAAFSIAQFFATPLLGSLSDRWGRKPVLVISLIGTCISFILFAQARSIIMLFAARILDGLTGGNISVAQAMVTDVSSPDDRAKNFGILSSSFGFGFVAGPALGGLLSKYGMHVPFYFAAGIALIGVLLTIFALKETHCKSGEQQAYKFSFVSLATILKKKTIGVSIFISFLLTMAQFAMIVGFQTFTTDELKLSPAQTGVFYAGFGITGIIMQLLVPFFTKICSSKSIILLFSTLICLGAMIVAGLATGLILFATAVGIYGLFNGLRNPMLNAIIADKTGSHEQGKILGINQSYISIGQTLGPITAGFVTAISLHSIFFLASLYILVAFALSFKLKRQEC
ncbi:MFS transporter [Mucilaginibacter sp. JRF]|uniref:MFS transporter n=1 Tax=Mucilaginibacter sp. JRF TaxID=2780088 RepID=UPI0018813D52|nr:MFS transporter [Mucilaginibacter sp. JRF]MBE9584100.1 MFS transporter [Mucilaginibacter sp. JRF]